MVKQELESIELALEGDAEDNLSVTRLTIYLTSLAHAAFALGRAAERERCAKLVEAYAQGAPLETLRQTGKEIAAALRTPPGDTKETT